jgi:hypothetical protein
MLTEHSLTIDFNVDPDLPEGKNLTEAFGLTVEEQADQHKKLATEFINDPEEGFPLKFFIRKLLADEIDGSFLVTLAAAQFVRPINQANEEARNRLRSIIGEN